MGPHILHIQKVLPLSDRRERLVEVIILYPVDLNTLRTGDLNCLNARSQGLNNLNKIVYCVSLKIYNKFTNYFSVMKCIVCGKQARVKNVDLRHPSCTVVM
jgi:hypothetical protein